jgi:hypothetical protein
VVPTKTRSCVKWHSATQTQQLFIISFICWGNSTFFHGHTIFIFLLGRTWTILQILHPSFRWLAGSVMVVICTVVLLVPLMLRIVSHNQFTISTINLTFSLLGLLFSEHSQVWSPSKCTPWPFHFGFCSIFNTIKLFRADICSKNNTHSFVHFMVFSSKGNSTTFSLPFPCLA